MSQPEIQALEFTAEDARGLVSRWIEGMGFETARDQSAASERAGRDAGLITPEDEVKYDLVRQAFAEADPKLVGRTVRYHGTRREHHGVYMVWTDECDCDLCRAEMPWNCPTRYVLLPGTPGDVELLHVRRESFTVL